LLGAEDLHLPFFYPVQPLGEEVGLLCSDNYSRANFILLDTGTLSKKKGLHLFLFVFDILIF